MSEKCIWDAKAINFICQVKVRSPKVKFEKWMHIVVWRMFLGHFSKRNPLLWTMNVCISKTYEGKNIGQAILRSSKVSFHTATNMVMWCILYTCFWSVDKDSNCLLFSNTSIQRFYWTCFISHVSQVTTTVRFPCLMVKSMALTRLEYIFHEVKMLSQTSNYKA